MYAKNTYLPLKQYYNMNATTNQILNLPFIRKQFPALTRDFTFLDNAGGSLVAEKVVRRVSDYLSHYSVQLGASYEVSAKAKVMLTEVTANMANYVNARRPQEVVIGSSSTMLLRILSLCISQSWKPGDEVIVSNTDHEANVTCWTDLKEKGIVIKIWNAHPDTFDLDLNDLKKLLNSKTKLVAVTHVSNILGTINPIKEIGQAVHQAGALFCVDGVAYAPHRLIDVQEFDADFYVYSCYKVFGPHIGLLYGKYELLENMKGMNHYFLKKDDIPYKFQPGNFNYELTYGLQGVNEYLQEVYDHHFGSDPSVTSREKYGATFGLIAQHEESMAHQLLDYLGTKSKIRIIGHPAPDRTKRVPTISFIHEGKSSPDIVSKIDPYKIGIRYGDFYAKKIAHDFGLNDYQGVVRVSMAHYNTAEEITKLIGALERSM